MSFDLSLIDKVDVGSATPGPARSSRFAPRARARPKVNPASVPEQPAETVRTEDTGQPEQPKAADPLPEAIHEPREADTHLHKTAKDVPHTNNQPQTHAPTQAPDTETLPSEGKLTSQAARETTKASGKAAVPDNEDDFDKDEGVDNDNEDIPVKKKSRKGSGRGPKARVVGRGQGKMSHEQQASVELQPDTATIKNYVDRAVAQERLRVAQKKRSQAENQDAEEEQEEQQLAIQAPPDTSMVIAPQVEIVNGQLVPKAQSLVVQAQAQPIYRRVTEYNSTVNNNTYSNRIPATRWSKKETDVFFNAVKSFGTNFQLIAMLFPGRDRRSLANKWKRENKLNPERVKEAYKNKGSLQELQKLVAVLENTEVPPDGVNDLGIEASELFGEGDVDSSDEEAVEEPRPATEPQVSGLEAPSGQGAGTAIQESVEPGVSFRKASRRKAAPAKSVPPDHNEAPSQTLQDSKTRHGTKKRGKASARQKQAQDTSDDEDGDDDFKGPRSQPLTFTRATRSRAVKAKLREN